jgi:hypothetical protein
MNFPPANVGNGFQMNNNYKIINIYQVIGTIIVSSISINGQQLNTLIVHGRDVL